MRPPQQGDEDVGSKPALSIVTLTKSGLTCQIVILIIMGSNPIRHLFIDINI